MTIEDASDLHLHSQLALRDAVTATVKNVFVLLDNQVCALPNRYGDSKTIHRERTRELLADAQRLLTQALDAHVLRAERPRDE